MQRWIYSKKESITLLSGVLILLYFISKIELFLVLAAIMTVLPILLQALSALKLKIISIELLVSIAVIAAFFIQNYEESAIVSFLFLFGGLLEQRTLTKTRSAIKDLVEMAPDKALLVRNNKTELVSIDKISQDDVLMVRTGDKIPVDGVVIEGKAAVNEAAITGESFAQSKSRDSFVYAGSLVDNGVIKIKASKVGEDTTFSKIIELVEEAQDSKSETERFIDRFAQYYTPLVLILAFVVYLVSHNLELAITVLVLGCPGALVIGVPISNVAGIGRGAKEGILIKGSEINNTFSKVDIMVFDKTGTLTQGSPVVSSKQVIDEEALDYLYAIENESDHPLAQAILKDLKIETAPVIEETDVIKGQGIRAISEGHTILVGNRALMESEHVMIDKDDLQSILNLEAQGHSLVLTALNKKLSIIMGIQDELRPHALESMNSLKASGIKKLVILSGDNQGSVDQVANKLNIDLAVGGMLPHEKSEYIKTLQVQNHTVAFIGDGINDSPSLALADIGIAMGKGTDVAIDTSDIVLMNDALDRLPLALNLSKLIARNMKQNIIMAVGVVVFLVLNVLLSSWMNMSLGMLIHEASILVVIFNGMRLLKTKVKT